MRNYLIAPVVALALVAATPAGAVEDYLKSGRISVPRDQWLSPSQISEKLQAQGYREMLIGYDD